MGRLVAEEDARESPVNLRPRKNLPEFPVIAGRSVVDTHDLQAVHRDFLVVQDADPKLPERVHDLRAVGKLIMVSRDEECPHGGVDRAPGLRAGIEVDPRAIEQGPANEYNVRHQGLHPRHDATGIACAADIAEVDAAHEDPGLAMPLAREALERDRVAGDSDYRRVDESA